MLDVLKTQAGKQIEVRICSEDIYEEDGVTKKLRKWAY